MTETSMRSIVIQLLKPICAFPVENTAADGTPDVCTSLGWIELKVGDWPKNYGKMNIVIRQSQVIWLKKWRSHGGNAWTLTMVQHEWFLHDGLWASEHFKLCSPEDFKENVFKVWHGVPSSDSLMVELIRSTMKMDRKNHDVLRD